MSYLPAHRQRRVSVVGGPHGDTAAAPKIAKATAAKKAAAKKPAKPRKAAAKKPAAKG